MSVTDPAPIAPSSSSLIARIQGILLTPAAEWDKIEGEPATVPGLFLGYAAILAAITPIATIIQHLLFIRWALPVVIVIAVLSYVVSLAGVFVTGLVIDALAPSFGAEKNNIQAMKLAVYPMTALWVAGILNIIPVLGILALLAGLYGLYILYLGLPKLMKSPADKTLGYFAVSVVVAFVVNAVLSWIVVIVTTALTVSALLGGAAAYTANNSHTFAGLQSAAAQIQAQATGQPAPAGAVHALPADTLKSLLPDNLPSGYARTEVSASSGGAAGIGGSNAQGVYTKGDSRITLDVTDMAAVGALASLASTMNVQSDDETATGYKKVGTVDGRMTTEEFDRQANSGKYSVLVANRFLVDAEGSGVSIDDLKAAVSAVGLDKLQDMAHA